MTLNEGEATGFGMRLTGSPSTQVKVKIEIVEQVDAVFAIYVLNSYGNTIRCGAGSVCEQRFDAVNWNRLKYVTIEALEDDDGESGSGKVRITTESNDSNYNDIVREVQSKENDTVPAPVPAEKAIVVSAGAAISVNEGSTATYTVKLSQAPDANVSVALSVSDDDDSFSVSPTSLTFTTGNYSTERTVTLTAAEDGDAVAGSATVSHSAREGGYANVTKDLTATEVENDEVKLVLSNFKSDLDLTEDRDSHAYQVKLGSEPSADVTINLRMVDAGGSVITEDGITVSPSTLTFTATGNTIWSTAQTVTISAPVDSDYTTDEATISHDISSSDTAYDALTIGDIAVTAVDKDSNLILSTSALTLQEGSSDTYTVKLNIAPTANVTVAIAEATTGDHNDDSIRVTSPSSKTLTFTPQNYGTAQTVRIRANSDSDAVNGTRTITHTASGAAEFADKTQSLTATERDSQARINLTRNNSNVSTITVVEEDTATYEVSLNAQPAANVIVTIAEATTGSYTDDDITVTIPSNKTLTFTPQNYDTAQAVTLRAATDDDLDNGSSTITHTASSPGSVHSGYDGSPVKSLTARESDTTGQVKLRNAADDADITAISVPEGKTATYQVVLSHQPKSAVTVRIALQSTSGANPGDRDITASPTTLYFNTGNWNQAKTVTVSARDDDDQLNGARDFVHTATGGGYNSAVATLTAIEQDADASFLFTGADGNALATLMVPENGSAYYRIALSTQPTATVLVDLTTTGDSSITVSPDLVIFTATNWNTPQQVTARAAEDGDATNDATGITHTVTSDDAVYGGKTGALAATEIDNDPGIVLRNAADDAYVTQLDVREGSAATYSVKLNSPPLVGDVTVTITGKTTIPGNDPDITLDTDAQTAGNQNTLTFTATDWNTPQTVTVRAANDNSVRKCKPGRVFTHTASGGGFTPIYEQRHGHGHGHDDVTGPQIGGAFPVQLEATELDNDSPHLVLCSANGNFALDSLIAPENAGQGYTVRLNRRPSGDVTVSIRVAASGDRDITVAPGSLTFTTTDWDAPQVVGVSVAEDDDLSNGARNISYTATGGYGSATLLAIEQDNDAGSLGGSSIVAFDSTATTVLLKATKEHSEDTYSFSFSRGQSVEVNLAGHFSLPKIVVCLANWCRRRSISLHCAQGDLVATLTLFRLRRQTALRPRR